MGFLQREYERLNEALRGKTNTGQFAQLYAAQQAIAWASDPVTYKAPSVMLTGTPADSEGCLSSKNPAGS
jgi:hypothetical protein